MQRRFLIVYVFFITGLAAEIALARPVRTKANTQELFGAEGSTPGGWRSWLYRHRQHIAIGVVATCTAAVYCRYGNNRNIVLNAPWASKCSGSIHATDLGCPSLAAQQEQPKSPSSTPSSFVPIVAVVPVDQDPGVLPPPNSAAREPFDLPISTSMLSGKSGGSDRGTLSPPSRAQGEQLVPTRPLDSLIIPPRAALPTHYYFDIAQAFGCRPRNRRFSKTWNFVNNMINQQAPAMLKVTLLDRSQTPPEYGVYYGFRSAKGIPCIYKPGDGVGNIRVGKNKRLILCCPSATYDDGAFFDNRYILDGTVEELPDIPSFVLDRIKSSNGTWRPRQPKVRSHSPTLESPRPTFPTGDSVALAEVVAYFNRYAPLPPLSAFRSNVSS